MAVLVDLICYNLLLLLIVDSCYTQSHYGQYFNQFEKEIIVEEHNALRRQEYAANMQEMVWNEDLAKMAAGVAGRCMADHSEWNSRVNKSGFAYSGESIFWSTFRWNMRAVVRNLHDEKPYYNYDSNTCHLYPGAPLTDCGHYTQIVWAKTCSVGCAYSLCNRISNGRGIKYGFMVVCKYGPGLDYNPMPTPFIMSPPCTQCGSQYANEQCRNNHWLCPSKCSKMTECMDRDETCPARRLAGECVSAPAYTREYCKLSCQVDGCGQ